MIVGVFPALRASCRDLGNALHEGGRGVIGGRQRVRTALVVAQVAGSLMLLIMAGLFTRSLGHVQQTNLGFDPKQVVNLTMDPAEVGYHPQQTREFYRDLLARIRSLPGVDSATSASSVPFGYYGSSDSPLVAGYQPPAGEGAPVSLVNYISTGYFDTLRIPLLHGRAFTDADNESAPYVAIVNDTFAKHFWPNQDAVGREFKLAGDTKHPLKIVGVARDVRYQFFTVTPQHGRELLRGAGVSPGTVYPYRFFWLCYSQRSAMIGSTRAARRAGMSEASTATKSSSRVTPAKVRGSVAPTP